MTDNNTFSKYKIALVKQEVYQDLYVCSIEEKNSRNVLLSSIMRVGPIGLIYELNADFIIVRESPLRETQIYKKVLPHHKSNLHLLKVKTANFIPGLEFCEPGSPFPNGHFAIEIDEIDWSTYDIVISINISIPSKVVDKCPKTLFCYMIGEANMATHRAKFRYDVSLNQKSGGAADFKYGVLDFPYSFMKGNTLKNITTVSTNESTKSGIYIEINSCPERPVSQIPPAFQEIQNQTGIEMLLHKQNIQENLAQLEKAKFYVKYGGRKTRGNGAIEAISMGAIVLIQPNKIIHREILSEELKFETLEELIKKIIWLNNNPDEFQRIQSYQRKIVDELFFNKPYLGLIEFLNRKRSGQLKYKLWYYRSWLDFKDILYSINYHLKKLKDRLITT